MSYHYIPPVNNIVELDSKIIILDLGSFEGFSPIWDKLKDKAELIGIDPFEPEGVRFGKFNRKETTFNCIIGDKDQIDVDFYIAENKHASSLLKENQKVVSRYQPGRDGRIIKTEKVNVKEISILLQNQNIKDLDFLKIDIEGAELTVMKNLENLLKNNCLGIVIECFFQEYHINRPLFSEIELYLRSLGYYVFDISLEKWGRWDNPTKYPLDHHGNKREGNAQVMFGNVLFFKDPILNNNINDIEKIKKLIELADLWDMKDYAIELKKHFKL
jgi:FkbM family methyltransferase